jgi:hypothetical protein
MALPSAGSSISLQQVNVELGETATDAINMGGTAVRGLFGIASGAIDMSDGYGKSASFYNFGITNSLRCNRADTGDLRYTPQSNSGQKHTISFWIKRSELSKTHGQRLFKSSLNTFIKFNVEDDLTINLRAESAIDESSGLSDLVITTNRLFRDIGAWYNIVIAIDTTQGTASNRVKLYVNGVQETSFSASAYPSQNHYVQGFSTSATILLGGQSPNYAEHFGGYMADINMIFGTAYAATSFGEFKNDVWIPKDTSGLTFGDQGFRYEMKQTGTSANSSGIGADTSGEGNHAGLAGSGFLGTDIVTDSPTNNFATLDPLSEVGTTSFTEGNLKVQVGGSSSVDQVYTTIAIPTTGKWYCEVGMTTIAANYSAIGLSALADGRNTGQLPRHGYLQDGQKIAYSTKSSYGNSFANGDVLGIAIDRDNRKLYFSKNGTFQASGDPANGTNAAFTSVTQEHDLQVVLYNATTSGTAGASTFIFNAGQDGTFAGTETAQGNADGEGKGNFYYAPPSGFLALCSENMPDYVAAIDPGQDGSPQDYFQTKLYTGNGSSSLDIDLDFTPNFVWIKNRDSHYSHVLANSVSGDDKFLASNGTGAEETDNTKFRNFLTNAFRVGSHNGVNANNDDYVSWNWKAGTSFSNDASSTSVGSIDSTGSVSSATGFSIINFTGTGNVETIAHGLSKAPEFIIEKSREKNDYWAVYAEPIGNTKVLILSGTNEALTSTTLWNDTSPTSTVWTIGTQNAINNSGQQAIAYLFHSVEGFSKIGTYTGNGNNNGAFAYTGFKPAWIIIKQTAQDDWGIYDNKRTGQNNDASNGNSVLYPNLDIDEETQASRAIDLLSNGFKLRTSNATFNENNGTYVFMAFAEQPFKYVNAR